MSRRLLEFADLVGEADKTYGLPISLLEKVKADAWETIPFYGYTTSVNYLVIPWAITYFLGKKWQLPVWFQKWFGGPLVFSVALGLWCLDDAATGIGMQAQELQSAEAMDALRDDPSGVSLMRYIEHNPVKMAMWQKMIDKGWVDTETAATRLEVLFLLVFFPTVYYFMKKYKMWGAGAGLIFLSLGWLKAKAGYGWLAVPNNPYGWSDYLTFKPGRRTPDRLFGLIGAAEFGEALKRNPLMYEEDNTLLTFHLAGRKQYNQYLADEGWK